MATFRLRYLSNPSVLRAIAPEKLLAFLQPHSTFFTTRGYDLPQPDDGEEIDYQKLIDIFMSPNESTPPDLVDALYLVDEMSSHEEMATLLEAAGPGELSWRMGMSIRQQTLPFRYGFRIANCLNASTPNSLPTSRSRLNTTRLTTRNRRGSSRFRPRSGRSLRRPERRLRGEAAGPWCSCFYLPRQGRGAIPGAARGAL